jgi:hypothetical protein
MHWFDDPEQRSFAADAKILLVSLRGPTYPGGTREYPRVLSSTIAYY